MTTFAGTIQLALWTKIKNGGMAKVNVTFIWGLLSRSLLFFLVTLNVNFVWSPDILFDLGNFDPLSGEYMQSGVVCGGSWGIQKNLFPSLSFSRWFPLCGDSFFLGIFPSLTFCRRISIGTCFYRTNVWSLSTPVTLNSLINSLTDAQETWKMGQQLMPEAKVFKLSRNFHVEVWRSLLSWFWSWSTAEWS